LAFALFAFLKLGKRLERDMDGQSVAEAASQLADNAGGKLRDISQRAAAGFAAAGETAQAAAEQARAAGVEAGARINRAAEQGGAALRDLSKRGSTFAQYLSEITAKYPIATLLAAAVAGYGLARLMRR
jgi:hypothetical protein